MIHLKEVDEYNWRLDLQVSEEQQNYVSSGFKLLARAWAYRHHRSCPLVIYDDETPVGMCLYYDLGQSYDFSQLFIDQRYQRKGYGHAAVELVLRRMREDGRYQKVYTCFVEGNDSARRLYEAFGFVVTDFSDGEYVMERNL